MILTSRSSNFHFFSDEKSGAITGRRQACEISSTHAIMTLPAIAIISSEEELAKRDALSHYFEKGDGLVKLDSSLNGAAIVTILGYWPRALKAERCSTHEGRNFFGNQLTWNVLSTYYRILKVSRQNKSVLVLEPVENIELVGQEVKRRKFNSPTLSSQK